MLEILEVVLKMLIRFGEVWGVVWKILESVSECWEVKEKVK